MSMNLTTTLFSYVCLFTILCLVMVIVSMNDVNTATKDNKQFVISAVCEGEMLPMVWVAPEPGKPTWLRLENHESVVLEQETIDNNGGLITVTCSNENGSKWDGTKLSYVTTGNSVVTTTSMGQFGQLQMKLTN